MDSNVRAARAIASSTRQASECKTHRCVAVRDPGHSLGWCVTQLATADDVLSNNSARRNKTSGPRTARGLGLGFSLPVALTSAAAVAKMSNAESFLAAASAASTTTIDRLHRALRPPGHVRIGHRLSELTVRSVFERGQRLGRVWFSVPKFAAHRGV